MADFPDWTGGGGGGGSFPTFTGSGNPEGVQVGNAGDTYQDTRSGIVFQKLFPADNGTANNWGWDMEGLVSIGAASPTYSGYGLPVAMSLQATSSIVNGQGYLKLEAGGGRSGVHTHGISLTDNTSADPAGSGGFVLNTALNGIGINTGALPLNTAPNNINISTNRGTTQVGSGDAITVVSNFAGSLGFYGSGGAGEQTVTGSKGGNAALASLLTALAALNLIVDSST